ncbi:MAG: Cna B-type domain-containing protein [Ruminococcaceae bacterium]|nr:Cna B-type domain-containing protein [Oscillospiraceae bacterium]
MSKFRRKLNSLLALALSVFLIGTTTAFAAESCSLQIIMKDSAEEPVPYINVELLQVARGEGDACALTSAFADLEIGVQELLSSPSAEYADRVFQYAYVNEIDGQVKHTSVHGTVDFQALEKGIYLVFERGGQMVAFQPYLVILPSEINGQLETEVFSIPKTSESDVGTLLVEKLWEDNMDSAGARPSYVDVTVLRDGIPIRSTTLSEANDWLHVFTMLPISGTYTVEEEAVTGYQAEYISVPEGYLILNRYTGTSGGGGGGGITPEPPLPEKAHVVVRKVWDDENDAAGKRPASITVQLIEGSTVIKTASLSEANHWEYTFTALDPAKSYTVQEIAVADYTAVYAGDAAVGITITNTYSGKTDPGIPPSPIIPEPETINIPVAVEWNDDGDVAGNRPDMVTVHLIADGSIIATIQLHPGNNWEGVFSGVPADLSYSVWQPGVAEYTTTYAGDAATGFVVTNTYTEGVTDPGIPPDPTLPVDPPDPVDPPLEPDGPTIPQTGAEVLPVYLLMAAGVILVLLGIIDLYRGRKES